jgi:pyruvate formate lyase activating enzyme
VSETAADSSGIIFDIQRFSVHDGPGIRTLVFFKGCPLACLWCSNPESQRFDPELLFDPTTCLACGGCVEVCPHGAVWRTGERLAYDRGRCPACGACADVCPAEARTVAGRRVAAQDVVAEVLKDAPFYANSGGGVTLGGGEPLAQSDFAREILERCRLNGVHTAIETCGHVPWGVLESILPWTDLFLYDLKHVDAETHRAQTGGDIALILSNLERLVGAGAKAIVRVPVIPGFNDTAEDIRAIAEQVARLGIGELHLLPYHRLGQNKYLLAGRRYEFAGGDPVGDGTMTSLRDVAAQLGLSVTIGG